MTEYTFDMVNNFGMFRDMHRHRALTLSRQLLTTDHGFSIPKELDEVDLVFPLMIWQNPRPCI